MQPGLFDLELDKILNDSGDLSATRASNLAGSSAIGGLCNAWKRRIDGDQTSTNTAVEALKKAWIEAGNDETHLLLLAILGKHGCTTALNIFLNDQRKSKSAVSDRIAVAIIQYLMDPDVAARWKPEAEAMFRQVLYDMANRRVKIFIPPAPSDSGDDDVTIVMESDGTVRDLAGSVSPREYRAIKTETIINSSLQMEKRQAVAMLTKLLDNIVKKRRRISTELVFAQHTSDAPIEDVKTAISRRLSPAIREEIIGLSEVRDVFRSPKLGAIAGCMVMEGVLKRNNPIRVLRDNVVVFEGALDSLRRFKDDVPEVKAGAECGLSIKGYNDVQVGDQIEGFERIDFDTTG